jgi:hypothetical protein
LIAASDSEARTSIIASGGIFFSMCDVLQTFRRANAEVGQSDDCRQRDFAELLGLSNG